MAILGALGALITGIGGQVVNDAVGELSKHLAHKRRIEEMKLGYDHETKLIEMQAQIKMGEKQAEMDIEAEKSAERAISKSFEHDISLDPTEYGWVEAVRALFRPLLTLALGIVLTSIYFTSSDVPDLEAYVTIGLVDAGLAAIGWWFASRTRKRNAAEWGIGFVNRTNLSGPYNTAGRDSFKDRGGSTLVVSENPTKGAETVDLMDEKVDK